ncbi:PAS domain-containing sensor histidine kinase [Croceimicrobium sp.]|uniref:PAS domain-containing sensor histidine kinase n=1 Tax=Croceimicrobium sp. TaxID=2828340 RepID=UPI003BA99E18
MNLSTTKKKLFSFEVDLEENSVWFSDSFYEMMNLSPSHSFLFNDYWSLVHPEDQARVRKILEVGLEQASEIDLKYRLQTSYGKTIYVYNESSFSTNAIGKVIRMRGMVMDISPYVNVQNRIDEMQDLLEMKDQAIAMIAHDLRNPISQVDGILRLLRTELHKEENIGLVDMGFDAVNHAYTILTELNEATRNKVAGKSIEKAKFLLAPLLLKVGDAFKIRLEEKGLHLHIDAPEDLMVLANENKIFRAVENLISNAIKFSKAGKTIHLSGRNERDCFCIAVEDQGIGMPESIRKRLFQGMNKDIRRVGTAGESSIGIGLSIVKGVVDLHQGKIRVESEEGKGSCFTICIPKP